jgi:uncharacterized protein
MKAVWDPAKAETNFRKHGVRFSDAEGALLDPLAISIEDAAERELRFVTIGLDSIGRIVVVVYAYRGDDVRLISARLAGKHERQQYEEGIRLQQRASRRGHSPAEQDSNHDSLGRRRAGRVSQTGRRRRSRLPNDDQ